MNHIQTVNPFHLLNFSVSPTSVTRALDGELRDRLLLPLIEDDVRLTHHSGHKLEIVGGESRVAAAVDKEVLHVVVAVLGKVGVVEDIVGPRVWHAEVGMACKIIICHWNEVVHCVLAVYLCVFVF